MELPVVNHEDYFAKIGDDHKFPINKFGELANYLTQNKIVSKFHKPSACSFETLSYAHSKNYILDINPIAFSIGPINVYWYGLAYMAGMILGLFYALKIIEKKKEACKLLITKRNIDEIFIWIVFGIIFGARLGLSLIHI